LNQPVSLPPAKPKRRKQELHRIDRNNEYKNNSFGTVTQIDPHAAIRDHQRSEEAREQEEGFESKGVQISDEPGRKGGRMRCADGPGTTRQNVAQGRMQQYARKKRKGAQR